MKNIIQHTILQFIILLYSIVGYPQNNYVDSLKDELRTQKADSNKVKLLINLSNAYAFSYADTGVIYAQLALDLAEKLNFDQGVFDAIFSLNASLMTLGNYPLLLDYSLKALFLAKKINQPTQLAMATGMLGECYYNLGEYRISLDYDREVIKIMDRFFKDKVYFMWMQMSRSFVGLHQYDSAILYAGMAYENVKKNGTLSDISLIAPILGNAFAGKGYYDSALFYYKMGIPVATQQNFATDLLDNYNGIAAVYRKKDNQDSALLYSKKVIMAKVAKSYPVGLLKAATTLSEIYQYKEQPDSVLKYIRIAISLKDSLFNREKMNLVQKLIYQDEEKQKDLVTLKRNLQNRLKLYAAFAGTFILIIVLVMFLKNRREKQLQGMRNSIADDLHDDIGSTLSSISIMSELAKAKSPEASALLNSIGESTTSIQENMSDIIWALKPGNDRFENVLQRMNQFALEILDAKNIAIHFTTNASVSALRLTMKQRKSFYLFFKEAINNAAKHSNAKTVSVSFFQEEHHIKMIIRDDGIGFDTTQLFKGNGMSTLQKRSEELSGYFKIQSYMNKGTVVELKFKTK